MIIKGGAMIIRGGATYPLHAGHIALMSWQIFLGPETQRQFRAAPRATTPKV
jgi:hypothetical protein